MLKSPIRDECSQMLERSRKLQQRIENARGPDDGHPVHLGAALARNRLTHVASSRVIPRAKTIVNVPVTQ
jgi:hypothetical protein